MRSSSSSEEKEERRRRRHFLAPRRRFNVDVQPFLLLLAPSSCTAAHHLFFELQKAWAGDLDHTLLFLLLLLLLHLPPRCYVVLLVRGKLITQAGGNKTVSRQPGSGGPTSCVASLSLINKTELPSAPPLTALLPSPSQIHPPHHHHHHHHHQPFLKYRWPLLSPLPKFS